MEKYFFFFLLKLSEKNTGWNNIINNVYNNILSALLSRIIRKYK